MNQLFFTSDAHFGSEKILIRENRPFDNINQFTNYILDLWNRQADEHDKIYFLGDFVEYLSNHDEKWKENLALVKSINAQVVLIIGNSEERIIKDFFDDDFEKFKQYCIKLGFTDVEKQKFLKIEEQDFYLNHRPIYHKDGFINLFGHTHRATGLWKPYGINVGCDLNHFFLHNIESINRILNYKSKYWDEDPDNHCMEKYNFNLNAYRDPFLAANINYYNFIGFYPREFFCFDNFSAFKVLYKGILYSTVEHAYQALKFEKTAPEIAKKIIESYSSDEAKRIADKNKEKQDKNWDNKKLDIMEELIRAKVEQNPYVKKKLLDTKNYTICEDSPKDSYWGIGADRQGQNNLGKIWMKIREELDNN